MIHCTPHSRCWTAAFVAGMCLCVWSCATTPYKYGRFSSDTSPAVRKIEVSEGESHKTLDALSDAASWPVRKLMPKRPDKRTISDETKEKVLAYLEQNDLADVHVEVRGYSPRRQWRRLGESSVVSPLARYTLGTFSVLGYSVLPGRLLGRNTYSPYTNTLYVNRDEPSLLLHEAAYAKSIRGKPVPDVYAAMARLPILSLGRELEGARDVVAYAQAQDDWDLEQDSYRSVFPHVGSGVTGGASTFVPVWWAGPVMGLAGAAAGNVAGQSVLARRERQREEEQMATVTGNGQGVRQAAYVVPTDERGSVSTPPLKRDVSRPPDP